MLLVCMGGSHEVDILFLQDAHDPDNQDFHRPLQASPEGHISLRARWASDVRFGLGSGHHHRYKWKEPG
jgi:hypothetical protein